MAARNFAPVRALVRELIPISGSFAPAGTGAVTDVQGKGFSVARTGVGTFTITFEDVYPALIAINANVQLAASANTVVQAGTYVAASRTLVLRTLTAGADADIAANANNRVHFTAFFRNASRG